MIILNLKHLHVFKNENKISFINLSLFLFKIVKKDVNSINSTVLNAEILMLILMT